jgi:glycosyltransferase involved in cell wall biosynthesis
MVKVIDLSFNYDIIFTDPATALERYKAAYGYAEYLNDSIDLSIIIHINYSGSRIINKVKYFFLNSAGGFWYIPLKTLVFVKRQRPDVIITQGLIFPFQVIALRFFVGRKVKILVQHHGERPSKGIKRLFGRFADNCVNGYIFTCLGNAKAWRGNNIIGSKKSCFEVLEGSTFFAKSDKKQAQIKLGIKGIANFLWVGRLEKNKDPLTVLKGFEKYLMFNPDAQLYMIYQKDDLLEAIMQLLDKNTQLKNAVKLIGRINHDQLVHWYNACDYFISGSHKEAAGYALIEAMACGCIPIITTIPPFIKITGNGKFGLLYETGNADSLLAALNRSQMVSREELSDKIAEHFLNKLSFKAIADDLYSVITTSVAK